MPASGCLRFDAAFPSPSPSTVWALRTVGRIRLVKRARPDCATPLPHLVFPAGLLRRLARTPGLGHLGVRGRRRTGKRAREWMADGRITEVRLDPDHRMPQEACHVLRVPPAGGHGGDSGSDVGTAARRCRMGPARALGHDYACLMRSPVVRILRPTTMLFDPRQVLQRVQEPSFFLLSFSLFSLAHPNPSTSASWNIPRKSGSQVR